ncbi:MAG: hypothetical protein QOF88_2187 [Mycobacterium sp.]|jgi:hypothetical protein|nr:hypothetical protein [Mycobacterium sp.]MDT5287298.1 hypothetical protein [Mycobacterium sp.]MDT5321943.1 hypothetical protein [Mycobacterium sp.]
MHFGHPGVVALLGAKSSTWPRSPAGIAGPSLHCTTDLERRLEDDIRESQNFVSEMTRRYDGHLQVRIKVVWLYQRECSPTPATHESICSTRPSASASPHTNLFNRGQVIGVCSRLQF